MLCSMIARRKSVCAPCASMLLLEPTWLMWQTPPCRGSSSSSWMSTAGAGGASPSPLSSSQIPQPPRSAASAAAFAFAIRRLANSQLPHAFCSTS